MNSIWFRRLGLKTKSNPHSLIHFTSSSTSSYRYSPATSSSTFSSMSSSSRRPLTRLINLHQHLNLHRSSSSSSSTHSNPSSEISQSHSLVLAHTDANTRVLTLNRPKVLNALNDPMIKLITSSLVEWESSPEANLIILKSTGRAFCAGGDVVTLTQAACSGIPEQERLAVSFFQQEYRLNAFLAKMSTPVICFMDGITMGGGLGLTMHVPFRIATENTRVAMPETTIGLFPDVGATFFLPRMDGELGTYLGLTSTNLYGWGAYQAGIASHYVPSASLPALQDHLVSLSSDVTLDRINHAINEFSADSVDAISSSRPYELVGAKRQAIDHCFKQDTVESIVAQLEAVEKGRLFSGQGLECWAQETRETILRRSPTSCKLTLMALREGKKLDIDECFAMELRLAATCCDVKTHPDFAVGVNHLLVKKEKSRAEWQPNRLEDVNLEVLQRHFFSSQAPATTHLLKPDTLPTVRKAYKAYPHAHYSLPSEELVKDHVVGKAKESGNFALTRKEVVSGLQRKWISKVGVKEKVEEVLKRRTVERGEKEGKVLNWDY